MPHGSVVSIYIHPGSDRGAPMTAVDSARVVLGGGLEGDRFFQGEGSIANKRGPDREVTLIEQEVIEAIGREGVVELSAEESRRNILTRGVDLNRLVDREFTVGSATLRGLRLCEPCGHLEDVVRPGLLKALVHRGGLRAKVVAAGEVRVGDAVMVDGDGAAG